jgi:hypothetical protein
MKILKTLLASSLLLAIAGPAFADTTTYIRFVGAQAWRASTYAAIGHILNSGYTYAYNSTSLSASNQAIFKGVTSVGSHTVIIKTSFAGATGGVAALTQNQLITTFLSDGVTTSTAGTPGQTTTESGVLADVADVDSPQDTTVFISPTLVTSTPDPVGIESYIWVKGATPPGSTESSLTNITSFQAQNLLNGGLPLQQFTGNSADANVTVATVGRDENSGARIVAFAESGFGVFSSPVQYQPTISGGSVTALNPWPSTTLNGITYSLGHSGYSSSNSVQTALETPISSTALSGAPGWIVSYLGTSDAATINTFFGTDHTLTWNGIPYSVANVQNGLYTFWGYAHLLYRSSLADTSTTFQKTVTNQIASQLATQDFSVSGIIPSAMKVIRNSEGGPVTY